MTTDITELARKVKTEASAIDDTQWYLAKPSEIRLLVEALEMAQTQIIALQQKAEIDPRTHEIIDLKGRIIETNDVLCSLLPDCRYMDPPDGGNVTPLEQVSRMISDYRQRIAELESYEVREEGNQFLVVRHPGKVPVIKHPVGELEDYLRQILKTDPLATIDIVTHRYYGVGGQFVEDADEYLHEMSIKVEAE
ncbi:TPA: hypothetical protein ACUB6D_002164 [Raoultella planticola]